MSEDLDRTPHWLRHTNPTVAGLLLAGWLMEQEGPAVADTIARAALPAAPEIALQDLVQDVSYMLRQAQALEDDPAAALHAQGIEVAPGNRVADVAGECCDTLRQDARRMAELAVRPHAVADPAPSSEFTRGLRELADFADAHPDLPHPYSARLQVSLAGDDTGLAEVGRIAAILGTTVDLTRADGGHRLTERRFGPIEYAAVSIADDWYANWALQRSYHGSVTA